MDNKAKVYVTGVGAITSVGGSTDMTAAAVKAGVNRYKASQFYNKKFEPMTLSLISEEVLPEAEAPSPAIKGLCSRQKRMLRIALPALEEVCAYYGESKPIPLFLAGPENVADYTLLEGEKYFNNIMEHIDIEIDKANSRYLATGRAGVIQAIEMAFRYFEATGNDFVLVGGVDTYVDHYLLGTLDMEDRVLAEGVMDGFAPAEAAGFLLISSEKGLQKIKNKPLATVYRPGLAAEEGHRYSDKPYKGDGLSLAFKEALANGSEKPVDSIFSSLNGESFGAKEYSVATMRNAKALKESYNLEHPSDCFGDIGAAFGAVLIGLVSKQKPGSYLVYCASENQDRAALNIIINQE